MKKIVIAALIILIVVFVTLLMFDSQSEYNAERVLHGALKQYHTVAVNPDVAPPKMLASIESNFKKIVTKFPDSKSAKMAYAKLIELYFKNKKYDEVLSLSDEILKKYESDKRLTSQVQFSKALAYELKDDWGNTRKELEILKEKYMNTPLGLQAQLYIAQYCDRKGKYAEAQEEYTKAVALYENLEKEYRGAALGYASSSLLVQSYLGLNNYEEAGRVVEDTIFNYPSMLTLVQQLPYVELIYVKTLNNPEKAKEIYKRIVEKTKDPKLEKFLEDKIEELEIPG